MAGSLNNDPRPILSGGAGDSFGVRIMLSILKHIESNYDSPQNPSRRAQS